MVTTFKAVDTAAPFRRVQQVRVSVNGVIIPAADIAREVQNHSAEAPIVAWQEAARSLAVRELLLQEARRLEIEPEPLTDEDGRRETEEEALIRGLIEQEVRTPAPDIETCRRYYERNRRRFRSPDVFEAAHILLPARPGEAEPLAGAFRLAQELLGILATRADTFGDLARAHSACPSANAGGNLGQFSPGDTTPEFEAALVALRPGETTATPIATRYGVHIIRLDRHIEGRTLPFEIVADRIAAYLGEASRRQATAQYIARLAAGADIQGVPLPSPADLRVN
jgi:peptidyl-prolyl cis-trans isomerase C